MVRDMVRVRVRVRDRVRISLRLTLILTLTLTLNNDYTTLLISRLYCNICTLSSNVARDKILRENGV